MTPGGDAALSPCSWPISYVECDEVGPEYYQTPDQRDTFEAMAAQYLWNWTGQVFGLCPVKVRPCRASCTEPARWGPALIGGKWFNVSCGACALVYGLDQCSCPRSVEAIRLPGPMHSVTEVLLGGVVMAPADYALTSGWTLIRRDGGRWPVCQDMSLPVTEPGTWQVTYLRGIRVPVGGQVAAGVLAIELAKAACGDASCQLPRRVQSITRQGVTVAMIDSFEDVDKGRTGVWLIDSWVASVTRRPRSGRVASVDIPRPRHRVTPGSPYVP